MIDPTSLAIHNKKDVKARRVVLDGVKDHIIPHLLGNKRAKEMWEYLTKVYQSDNQNHKMVLREKLRSNTMARFENVSTYLTKITQMRDDLVVVGENMQGLELVRITLNGFSK